MTPSRTAGPGVIWIPACAGATARQEVASAVEADDTGGTALRYKAAQRRVPATGRRRSAREAAASSANPVHKLASERRRPGPRRRGQNRGLEANCGKTGRFCGNQIMLTSPDCPESLSDVPVEDGGVWIGSAAGPGRRRLRHTWPPCPGSCRGPPEGGLACRKSARSGTPPPAGANGGLRWGGCPPGGGKVK